MLKVTVTIMLAAESFFSTIKREEINRKEYKNIQEAKIEIFDYIEVFYNSQRLHSALGYRTPAEVAANVA